MASDCKSAAFYVLRRFESYSPQFINFFLLLLVYILIKIMVSYKGDFIFEEFSIIDLGFDQLIEADYHIGSKLSRFEKLNFNYVFAKRFDNMVINLYYSIFNLRLAIFFLTFLTSRRGKILFFDSLEGVRNFVEIIGVTSKQYFINKKWIAGLLTNFKNFYPAVFSGISRHFRFSQGHFSGMRYIHRPPNATCLLNIDRGSSAFYENFRLGIPTIALVNSDNSLSGVTYPIFSNNSSVFTYFSFFSILRSAILNGYKDEIYKFYRRNLKKNLKIRYQKILKKSKMTNGLFSFFREYFINFFFENTVFLSEFSTFIYYQFKNSLSLFKYFSYVLKECFFFFDKTFFQHSFKYSLYNNIKTFELSHYQKIFFETPESFFDSSFFYKFIKLFFLFFFSEDYYKSSILFFDRFYPFFIYFLDKFLLSNDKIKFHLRFKNIHKKLNIFLLFFRIWFSHNLNHSFLLSSYDKNVIHELFPFFDCFIKDTILFAKLYYKIIFFKIKTYGFFSGSLAKILNFRAILKLHKYFFNLRSFKIYTFSKKYKRFVRGYVRRLKFFQFLNKNIMTKKIDFFKNKNYKFRTLELRSDFNFLTKQAMLEYFDEEFDDFKFPVNNEFFFFQVAYGSAYLTRQYVKEKTLQSQKVSVFDIQRNRQKKLKLKSLVRINRSLLFFYYLNNKI